MDEAIAALHSGDIFSRGRAVTKAIEILAELRASLRCDVHAQYSNTLAELYGYMQQQLIRAHRDQSETMLLEVSRLLNTLLEGWIGAMGNLSSLHAAVHEQDPVEHQTMLNVANPYSPAAVVTGQQGRSWQL